MLQKDFMMLNQRKHKGIRQDGPPFFQQIRSQGWMIFLQGVHEPHIGMQSFIGNCRKQFIQNQRISQTQHGVKGIQGRPFAAAVKTEIWCNQFPQGWKIDFGWNPFISHKFIPWFCLPQPGSHHGNIPDIHFHLGNIPIPVVSSEQGQLIVDLGKQRLFTDFQSKRTILEQKLLSLFEDSDMTGRFKTAEEFSGSGQPGYRNAPMQKRNHGLGRNLDRVDQHQSIQRFFRDFHQDFRIPGNNEPAFLMGNRSPFFRNISKTQKNHLFRIFPSPIGDSGF